MRDKIYGFFYIFRSKTDLQVYSSTSIANSIYYITSQPKNGTEKSSCVGTGQHFSFDYRTGLGGRD